MGITRFSRYFEIGKLIPGILALAALVVLGVATLILAIMAIP